MRQYSAEFPAAIGFIFRAYLPLENDSPTPAVFRKYGSTGVGSTVNKSVTATVNPDGTEIFFNGTSTNIPTIGEAVRQVTDRKFSVRITSELPLGCGFGISGAATLATLTAVNKLHNLGLNPLQCAEIAHFAEIRKKTGLGTVATQTTGGFLIKTKPGIPPEFTRLPISGRRLSAIILGRLETPRILGDSDKILRVNRSAEKALKLIRKESPSLNRILDIAYGFLQESNLFGDSRAMRLADKIREKGGHASIAILGNVVLTTFPVHHLKYKTVKLTIK